MMKYKLLLLLVLIGSILISPLSSFGQIETLDFDKYTITKSPQRESLDSDDSTTNNSKKIGLEIEPIDLIHYGDLIDVDVLGSVEYDWRGKVAPEGFLSGPNFVNDGVFAACKTTDIVGKEIAKSYSKFLKSPKVVVSILDKSGREKAVLYGAVKQPMRFKLKRSVRLNELVILAGGFTDSASGNIQILRQSGASCAAQIKLNRSKSTAGDSTSGSHIKISDSRGTRVLNTTISDLIRGLGGANLEIFYGDVITVKKADPIYIIGGVENPRKFMFRQNMTVTRAIASAGGLVKGANATNVTVYRRDGRNRQVININLNEVKSNKTKDLQVMAFDVIEVSLKGVKKRKYPPVFRYENTSEGKTNRIPLRVID